MRQKGLSCDDQGLIEYLKIIEDVYNNYDSKVVFPENAKPYGGETHYTKGNVLLRLDHEGNFRSAYPLKDKN